MQDRTRNLTKRLDCHMSSVDVGSSVSLREVSSVDCEQNDNEAMGLLINPLVAILMHEKLPK